MAKSELNTTAESLNSRPDCLSAWDWKKFAMLNRSEVSGMPELLVLRYEGSFAPPNSQVRIALRSSTGRDGLPQFAVIDQENPDNTMEAAGKAVLHAISEHFKEVLGLTNMGYVPSETYWVAFAGGDKSGKAVPVAASSVPQPRNDVYVVAHDFVHPFLSSNLEAIVANADRHVAIDYRSVHVPDAVPVVPKPLRAFFPESVLQSSLPDYKRAFGSLDEYVAYSGGVQVGDLIAKVLLDGRHKNHEGVISGAFSIGFGSRQPIKIVVPDSKPGEATPVIITRQVSGTMYIATKFQQAALAQVPGSVGREERQKLAGRRGF